MTNFSKAFILFSIFEPLKHCRVHT